MQPGRRLFAGLVLLISCHAALSGVLEETEYTPSEIHRADAIRDKTEAPSSLMGDMARKMFTCEGKCSSSGSNFACQTIRGNDELKTYCETSNCQPFSTRSYKSRMGFSEDIHDFCKTGISSYLKSYPELRDYYDNGYLSKLPGGSKTQDAARKYVSDRDGRKKWVLFFLNGYTMK